MTGVFLTCLVTFGGDQKAQAHFNAGTTPGDIDLKHLMLMDEASREFKHFIGADELSEEVLADLKRQIHIGTKGVT